MYTKVDALIFYCTVKILHHINIPETEFSSKKLAIKTDRTDRLHTECKRYVHDKDYVKTIFQ